MASKVTKKKRLLVYLIAAALWTFLFLCLAAFSAIQAQKNEADLIEKIQLSLEMQLQNSRLPFALWLINNSQFEEITQNWIYSSNIDTIQIRAVSAEVQIVASPEAKEVKIKASGYIHRDSSGKLFNINQNRKRIELKELESDGTRNVTVTIEIPKVLLKKVLLQSISGSIVLENTRAEVVEVKTVSGKINLEQVETQNLELESMSGDIVLTGSKDMHTQIKTTSGDVYVLLNPEESKRKFIIETRAGDIRNPYQSVPTSKNSLRISSVSGDIEIE